MLTQKMKQPFKTAQPVLFPPLADRAAWENLPGAARWAAAGQAALADAQTAPELPLSLWLQFNRSGDRAKWEHAYFARRRTLCALAMAEAVTNRGTYLPALADLAWRICEESAWQLPAHNSYIRDTPQLPLPDVTRPIVDLFAAETGALIATVCGLLGAALDAYAPGLAARLRGEVERRVLTPYRTAHFWWMGSGDEPMCNWTPWCTQNVLLAAAQCAPAEDLPAYVQQAAYSIDCFLKDYGDDGCCSEGAQYYRHAALTMFNALDLLCKIAPGVFDDIWAEPKIKNMAEYIVNMHIAGPYHGAGLFKGAVGHPCGKAHIFQLLMGLDYAHLFKERLAVYKGYAAVFAYIQHVEGLGGGVHADGLSLKALVFQYLIGLIHSLVVVPMVNRALMLQPLGDLIGIEGVAKVKALAALLYEKRLKPLAHHGRKAGKKAQLLGGGYEHGVVFHHIGQLFYVFRSHSSFLSSIKSIRAAPVNSPCPFPLCYLVVPEFIT